MQPTAEERAPATAPTEWEIGPRDSRTGIGRHGRAGIGRHSRAAAARNKCASSSLEWVMSGVVLMFRFVSRSTNTRRLNHEALEIKGLARRTCL